MAQYEYGIDDFSLTSTWKAMMGPGDDDSSNQYYAADIVGDSTTKSFAITGITLGENESIQKAVLTATITRTSGYTDYKETISVNGLPFASGVQVIDVAEIPTNSAWSATFYMRASGYAKFSVNWEQYSCTITFSNVKLILTTGTGSVSGGTIGDLPDGTKIKIDEANGTGIYTIVKHNYNSGKCLLWRDDVYANSTFNDNTKQFSGGNLDTYLNSTFYESLPSTTKSYVVSAQYPTMGTLLTDELVSNLERYVCTPSTRELFSNAGDSTAAEGVLLDYLDTIVCGTTYWTRTRYYYNTSTKNAYYVSDTELDYFSGDSGRSRGVRPAFCVLETQIVIPDDDYYKLSSQLNAPSSIYLNGSSSNLFDKQAGYNATLSWSAVGGENLRGYAVWRCTTPNGTYELCGETTETSINVYGPDDGFLVYYYKVQSLGPDGSHVCDSNLSDAYRTIASKRTNVKYYDGNRWLLAAVKYYSVDSWSALEGVKYYNGNQWILPEKIIVNYTNVLPSAIDSSGNIYNGIGYKTDTRISTSSGVDEDRSETGHCATGYIACTTGDIIRLANCTFNTTPNSSGTIRAQVIVFNSNKEIIYSVMSDGIASENTSNWYSALDDDGNIIQFKIPSNTADDDVGYIRIVAQEFNEDSVITVNEEIV